MFLNKLQRIESIDDSVTSHRWQNLKGAEYIADVLVLDVFLEL
jgi:hypothetical protein